MDVADVAAKEQPLRRAKERLTRLSSALAQEQGSSVARRVFGSFTRLLRKARSFTAYLTQSREQMLRDQTTMILFRLYLKFGLRLPAFLRHIPVRTAYAFARRGYRPASSFDGELTLIRATSGTGNDEPYADRYVDPLLGWGPRATRGVRVIDVPGGHSSMLQEPNVRDLAKHLQACIESAMVQEPPVAKIPRRSRLAQLLIVSASSREAVQIRSERLAEQLEDRGDSELPDVSYTLTVGRQAFEWRRAVVAESPCPVD